MGKLEKAKSSGTGGNKFHSAVDGKFVTEKYAKAHPKTTFKESLRKVVPAKLQKAKGKKP